MRKNRVVGLFVVSLLSWIIISYFFLNDLQISHHISIIKSPVVEDQLSKLEEDISDEFSKNAKIFDSFRRSLEQKLQKEKLREYENKLDAEEKRIKAEEEKNIRVQNQLLLDHPADAIAVVVIACNRVTVTKCLDALLEYRTSAKRFPILVSQDCHHEPTAAAIRKYASQVVYMQQPDHNEPTVPSKEKGFKGYYKIARHYGWVLNQTFFEHKFNTAIVIEDDLEVSSDVFEYFAATLPLLQGDPSLWCVSAWNDNGKEKLIDATAPQLLYRTDFFSGLGWMLTKPVWAELAVKWPPSYWDDWIRKPDHRKGRACIRPEISRTRTFGKIGVSNGLFFEKHLKYIRLNEQFVPFTRLNLTYLLKDSYDVAFVREVYNSRVVTYEELKTGLIAYNGSVRIPYHTKQTFQRTAKMLGLMDDFKSGVPRTAYRGVVSFYFNNRRVYLAPNVNWKGYDIGWS